VSMEKRPKAGLIPISAFVFKVVGRIFSAGKCPDRGAPRFRLFQHDHFIPYDGHKDLTARLHIERLTRLKRDDDLILRGNGCFRDALH
jgi:hypothetical protein